MVFCHLGFHLLPPANRLNINTEQPPNTTPTPFPSDLSLVRHDGESVERAQGLLHVHVTDAQGLREGPGLRQGQGAGGVRRPRPTDLPLGREHANGAHGLQQHRHQYVFLALEHPSPPMQWCIVGLVVYCNGLSVII